MTDRTGMFCQAGPNDTYLESDFTRLAQCFKQAATFGANPADKRLPMLFDDCLTSNSLFQQTPPRNTFCSVFFWADSSGLV